MADNSKIQWTEATWNPVTGCIKVSPGCDHCYAETFAERWRGTPGHYFEGGFDVQLRPDKLDLPLRWKRPRRVFVNSMSDLFHDDVPDEYIAKVFAVMALAPQHTFQLLTKRHARMRSLLNDPQFRQQVADHAAARRGLKPSTEFVRSEVVWPLPNVWAGVSVEDQKWADIRVPALLDTPAVVRWISAEPLLGPLDLSPWLADIMEWPPCWDSHSPGSECAQCVRPDWIVVGGESGPGARPMAIDWAYVLVAQCQAAEVPVFVKQLGSVWASLAASLLPVDAKPDRKGGTPDYWPEGLNVREYPRVAETAVA